MTLGSFDTIEVITLLAALFALFFVFRAYSEKINTPASKKFWTNFLMIAAFVFLNRLFTNIEVLAYKPFFNLLEHLSILIVALIFIFVAKNTLKGVSNG